MPEYTMYEGVTHYTLGIDDVYDSDCYFICEFTISDYKHLDGFSNSHRNSLPTIDSQYPNCVGCLQEMIRDLESELSSYVQAVNFNQFGINHIPYQSI